MDPGVPGIPGVPILDWKNFPFLTPNFIPPPLTSLPLWRPQPILTPETLKAMEEKAFEDRIKSVVAWSIGPFRGIHESICYRAISKYLLTKQELIENGFPYYMNPLKEKDIATIENTKYYRDNPCMVGLGTRGRTCCRCGKKYELGPPPAFENPLDLCFSHMRPTWDPKLKKIVHPCCGATPDKAASPPSCVMQRFHVYHSIFYADLLLFSECPDSNGSFDIKRYSVYALDCEMVFTAEGSALARVSLVDLYGSVHLDLMVKPKAEVYDTNQFFSGLTKKQVEEAPETLKSAREKLFRYISKDTILIGHSLEADLRALRLVHDKIIDTSVLFACNNKKRSLKHLAYDLLGRDIQQPGGHDSTEDAKTCIQLLAYKMDSEEGRAIPEEVKDSHLDPNFEPEPKEPLVKEEKKKEKKILKI